MEPGAFSAQLSDYFVIESRLVAIEPNEVVDNARLFADYAIDLDYRVDRRSEHAAALYTKIAVNGGKEPLHGYAIYVEAVTLFGFGDALTEAACSAWLSGPGLTVALANIRTFIAGMTSYGPFGKYTLPEDISTPRK